MRTERRISFGRRERWFLFFIFMSVSRKLLPYSRALLRSRYGQLAATRADDGFSGRHPAHNGREEAGASLGKNIHVCCLRCAHYCLLTAIIALALAPQSILENTIRRELNCECLSPMHFLSPFVFRRAFLGSHLLDARLSPEDAERPSHSERRAELATTRALVLVV